MLAAVFGAPGCGRNCPPPEPKADDGDTRAALEDAYEIFVSALDSDVQICVRGLKASPINSDHAGSYNATTKVIKVAENLGDRTISTAWHELCHAVERQNRFDLEPFRYDASYDEDPVEGFALGCELGPMAYEQLGKPCHGDPPDLASALRTYGTLFPHVHPRVDIVRVPVLQLPLQPRETLEYATVMDDGSWLFAFAGADDRRLVSIDPEPDWFTSSHSSDDPFEGIPRTPQQGPNGPFSRFFLSGGISVDRQAWNGAVACVDTSDHVLDHDGARFSLVERSDAIQVEAWVNVETP